MSRIVCAALGLLLFSATRSGIPDSAYAFPPRLETYFSSVKLSTADRKRLTDNAPVTRMLAADASKEIAVFGAIWIHAPIARYIEAVNDIEHLESGPGYRVTRRISAHPVIGDFSALRLTDSDFRALRACRVGACDVKLWEGAIERFQNGINWHAANARAAADALMQKLALEYVTAYLDGGNERLAVYRDKSRPRSVAEEFRSMLGGMPELSMFMPDIQQYLLDYPRVARPEPPSFLYWQETEFGVKPTIRISHLTVREGSEETVVASKMLYASHYFWTGIELRALIPDASRGAGFWFITVSRSRLDGLTGFAGAFVRHRVRSEVQEKTSAGLLLTKQKLERAR
ncbi:hypothetical protein BH18ACI5_BH18ACI5_07800 [soil metagenome]